MDPSSSVPDDTVFSLQSRLVETRQVYPPLLKKLYQHLRAAHNKLLRDTNTDVEDNKLPDIPEELYQICNRNYQEHDAINIQLLEQIRVIAFLAEKKNCEISKVIDAI